MIIKFKTSLVVCILMGSIAFGVPQHSFASNGVIDSISKYAWGDDLGWINFSPTNGNVEVSDSALSGYAWSDAYGWINLRPVNAGVNNNGNGILSGYAWGENVGYIDFSNVRIDPATGVFSGTASTTGLGSITFDCANCRVLTTWRIGSAGTSAPAANGPVMARSLPIKAPVANAVSSSSESVLIAELQAKLEALLNEARARGISLPQGSALGTAGPVFSRNLTLWSHGADVTRLQTFLIQKNVGPAARLLGQNGITPFYGTLTKKAVVEYQKAHGLPATGYFGPRTRQSVNMERQIGR